MKKTVSLIALIIITVGAVYLFFPSYNTEATVQEVLAKCADDTSDHSFCYEKELPALYPTFSIPDVFSIIREVRRLDPTYQFCHVAAHKLGEEAVAEDPSRWLSLMALNPADGMCSNGLLHGVIVGKFRNDVLDDATLEKAIPDFAKACEPRSDWNPSPLDQAICYHGMGHLFMFISNADIRKSLSICDRIGVSDTGNYMRVCREGVFMQIYQPLEPDDYALIDLLPEKPTRENYRRLCAAYENNAEEGACLREAWPLYDDGVRRGKEVVTFCSRQPDATETDYCYESAMTIMGRGFLANHSGAKVACDTVVPERRAQCYTIIAQTMLEEDRNAGGEALDFCASAGEADAEHCEQTLAERASFLFIPHSPMHQAFCGLVPQQYKTICGA